MIELGRPGRQARRMGGQVADRAPSYADVGRLNPDRLLQDNPQHPVIVLGDVNMLGNVNDGPKADGPTRLGDRRRRIPRPSKRCCPVVASSRSVHLEGAGT